MLMLSGVKGVDSGVGQMLCSKALAHFMPSQSALTIQHQKTVCNIRRDRAESEPLIRERDYIRPHPNVFSVNCFLLEGKLYILRLTTCVNLSQP